RRKRPRQTRPCTRPALQVVAGAGPRSGKKIRKKNNSNRRCLDFARRTPRECIQRRNDRNQTSAAERWSRARKQEIGICSLMIDQRDRLAVVRQQVKQSMTARKISVFLFCLLLASPAWSNVFLRWTQSAVPPAKSLGVTELVLPWNPDSLTFALTARKQGYHVYVQATAEQVPQLANAASSSLAGVIVEIPASQQSQADDTLQKLRSSYPNLRFLLLDPNGKQPQMKGTMVVKRDGILEI